MFQVLFYFKIKKNASRGQIKYLSSDWTSQGLFVETGQLFYRLLKFRNPFIEVGTLPADSFQADMLRNSVSMRIDTASLSVPGKQTLNPFGWCGNRIVINQFTTATFMNYTCKPAFQSGLLKNSCHLARASKKQALNFMELNIWNESPRTKSTTDVQRHRLGNGWLY